MDTTEAQHPEAKHSFAYCSWCKGYSRDARLVQVHDQGSAHGARGLSACAGCRTIHRLAPVEDQT